MYRLPAAVSVEMKDTAITKTGLPSHCSYDCLAGTVRNRNVGKRYGVNIFTVRRNEGRQKFSSLLSANADRQKELYNTSSLNRRANYRQYKEWRRFPSHLGCAFSLCPTALCHALVRHQFTPCAVQPGRPRQHAARHKVPIEVRRSTRKRQCRTGTHPAFYDNFDG